MTDCRSNNDDVTYQVPGSVQGLFLSPAPAGWVKVCKRSTVRAIMIDQETNVGTLAPSVECEIATLTLLSSSSFGLGFEFSPTPSVIGVFFACHRNFSLTNSLIKKMCSLDFLGRCGRQHPWIPCTHAITTQNDNFRMIFHSY